MIVTASHVIKGMVRGTWRTPNNRSATARKAWTIGAVLNYDEQSDVALLEPETDPRIDIDLLYTGWFGSSIRPLALAAGVLRPGQVVYALGNPEGLTGTISQGIVSAAPRQFKEGTRIQVSAPISPGSSGGPVVNSSGEVVGIAESFLEEGQNLNFAVPVSLLSQLLKRTPSVPDFGEWQRAVTQRKSEKDWLWLDDLDFNKYVQPNESLADKPVPGWQFVNASDTIEYYMSRGRITPTPEHTLLAWLKSVPNDTPKGRESRKETIDNLIFDKVDRSYAFSYSMEQYEFDCGHQKMRRLGWGCYDKEGVILFFVDLTRTSPSESWETVLPGSVSEGWQNFVCKERE